MRLHTAPGQWVEPFFSKCGKQTILHEGFRSAAWLYCIYFENEDRNDLEAFIGSARSGY